MLMRLRPSPRSGDGSFPSSSAFLPYTAGTAVRDALGGPERAQPCRGALEAPTLPPAPSASKSIRHGGATVAALRGAEALKIVKPWQRPLHRGGAAAPAQCASRPPAK